MARCDHSWHGRFSESVDDPANSDGGDLAFGKNPDRRGAFASLEGGFRFYPVDRGAAYLRLCRERTLDRRGHQFIAHHPGRIDLELVLSLKNNIHDMTNDFQDKYFDELSREELIETLKQHEQELAKINKMICRGTRWKSKTTLWGQPLVCIATGSDLESGEMRGHAKGIIAIGDIATGVLAIGGVSRGIVSIGGCAVGGLAVGGCSVGLISLGGCAIGILVALGGLAVGTIAAGGCAVGIVAIGGQAFGYHAFGPQTFGWPGI